MVEDVKLNNPLADAHPHLPGSRTNYLENQFNPKDVVLPSPETGSILIIGSATDGPVGEPISVRELGGVKTALEVFGGLTDKIAYQDRGRTRYVEVPNNNKLTRALMEAANNGSDDIRLLRVDGRHAKTEIFGLDSNAGVEQPLSDASGSNIMNGNMRFMIDIRLKDDERLLNITKIEEVDKEGVTVQVKEGSEGYIETIEGFENNVEVHFDENMYTPGNELVVHYKVSKRDYISVDYLSPDGLLTQDPTDERYFISTHENWSDDPTHTINLFLVEKGAGENGEDVPHAIPSMIDGKFLYRPGKGDPNVQDPLTEFPSAEEFRQGGIRFTSEFDKHVASGLYPSLSTPNLVAMADYTRFESEIVDDSKEEDVKGQNKSRALRSTPNIETLEVFYIFNDERKDLELDKDFKLLLGSDSNERDFITINPGAAPIGAKLYAHYNSAGASSESTVIEVKSKYPGERYGRLVHPEDKSTISGVKISVEYALNPDGSPNEEHRALRVVKPREKMLSSVDFELYYSSLELREIRTVRQLANYINNDARNNVIQFVPPEDGEIFFKDLKVTPNTFDQVNGVYEYHDVFLGYKYNKNENKYELFENENVDIYSKERYPWLGDDGLYDNTDLKDMAKYYDKLGGVYGWDYERSTEDMVLLEPGVFTDLENYPVEQVRLIDVYANTAIGEIDDFGEVRLDRDKSFATQLAQFCATLSARTDYSTGIIDMAPVRSTKLRDVQEAIDLFAGDRKVTPEIYDKYVRAGVNPHYKNEHNLYNPRTGEEIYNEYSQPIDIGFFISVVFGPEVALSEVRLGNYVAPGGTMLASLISKLPVIVSTTNHEIGILGLRYTLSSPQHQQLLMNGYVTFDLEREMDGRKRYIVKDGVTAGRMDSDYRLLSTIRITNMAVHVVRQSTKGYIGKSGGIAQENSMTTDVQAALDRLKTQGVLTDFRFTLTTSNQERLIKNVYIDLEIVPAFEVRRIRTTVTVTDSLD